MKIALGGGGGGGLEPPQIGAGGAERGFKARTLISSIEMPEILPPTIPKCRGLSSSCVSHGHTGTSIVTGGADVRACISSLARSMRQFTDGPNKW